MFFIFGLPCTKNAKSDFSKFVTLREKWSFIKLRLKERILGKETIEFDENDGIKLALRKLYPIKRNFSAEKTSKSVAQQKLKAQKLGNDTVRFNMYETSKSIRKPETLDLNPLAVHQVTLQYKRLVNFGFFRFELLRLFLIYVPFS